MTGCQPKGARTAGNFERVHVLPPAVCVLFLFGSFVGVGAAESDLHFGRGDAGFMIVYNKLVLRWRCG